ncbi:MULTISPECIES: Wzz/FepE/Etk N-terminal domain-containing protein [unclassified Polaromonas]|uniref:Wzz/FepE/Etk N-terminal domain-containing protein n=1 Tax=unclassified Polaromonas TaxID=2638319 RepID=UPI0018C9E91B|nr:MULTISPECIES: Wzz/FepE/Etk N-terminal domain-containing protein [unclassified Polaromonas]MBG6070801.1 LPS O-antigen subunit length determinant protein (WzzB/FepE family) [Polaromonas sp. CG_9.7]MBG6112889.1 LPS O-antigen subunit length determinant protein (WzzB/FepE family) [Polaromonas sp. CG_9.2]
MQDAPKRVSTVQNEVGLLDLLVTLAENIKLLVVGPLIVGICALGVSFLLPQTFQSVAVLQADQATASLMTTATVLDPVVASLGLAKDVTVEEARTKLREQSKTNVGRVDKLLTLTVSAHTASQAQAINSALLQQTYVESSPKGSVRARLVVQLEEAKIRLKNAQDASVGVLKRLESNSSGTTGGMELARGYAELLSATGTAQGQVSLLEAQLEGLSNAQLVQAPTMAQKPSQPKKGLIAIGATLAAGLIFLLFVFIRQGFLGTTPSQQNSEKILRIRNSFGLK